MPHHSSCSLIRRATTSTLFPYTTLFRSDNEAVSPTPVNNPLVSACQADPSQRATLLQVMPRSEEHTSELQSRGHLVCRLLLEKKKEMGHGGRAPSRTLDGRLCRSGGML